MGEAALIFPADMSQGPAFGDHERAYLALRQRVAATKAPAFWPAFPPKAPLSVLEKAGLIRLIGAIPGLCSEAKTVALIEIMRHAPAGDIVEIGSGWGASAALFARLSEHYDLGKVLCIDRWLNEDTIRGGAALDPDEALRMFQINLSPLAGGRLNYIRAQSDAAASLYRPDLAVSTETFGDTNYAGSIAVLHLALEDAGFDLQPWLSKVTRGGWIIFGGAAAAAMAEDFTSRQGDCISAMFEAGGARFVQLRCAHHD